MGILAALGLLAWSTWGAGEAVDPEGSNTLPSDSEGAPDAGPSDASSADLPLRGLVDDLGELGEEIGGAEGEDAALQAAQAIERAMGELGEAHVFEREGDVASAATWVLESYRDGGATLFEASYLDFLGRAWGCVVADAGWVDVCCVREVDGGNSLVEVVRLDAHEWEEALASDVL